MGKCNELDLALKDLCSAAATINEVAEMFSATDFVNANSTTAVHFGVYDRVIINFYAFNSNGNKCIAYGLNSLQLISLCEPLADKASFESDFITDVDDDFLN